MALKKYKDKAKSVSSPYGLFQDKNKKGILVKYMLMYRQRAYIQIRKKSLKEIITDRFPKGFVTIKFIHLKI